LDGVNTSVVGGFLDSNWKQLYIQIAYIGAVVAYTFVVTALIVKSVDILPGLQLRSSEEGETLGTDDTEIGEFAMDYIEVHRHFNDWTPPTDRKLSEKLDEKGSESMKVHVSAGDRLKHPKQPNADLYTHSQMKLHANSDANHSPSCDIQLHSAIAHMTVGESHRPEHDKYYEA